MFPINCNPKVSTYIVIFCGSNKRGYAPARLPFQPRRISESGRRWHASASAIPMAVAVCTLVSGWLKCGGT